MAAYYNEWDPYAAAWLRNLIKAGHIAPGEVDERSIIDVQPADLDGFSQCHFFAGIGGWSLALRIAGWPDDRPVWTGSCPCQPFSAAGKRGGFDDTRHLWPELFRLIRECKPPTVFGEQVASSIAAGKYGGDAVRSLWEIRQFLFVRKDWLQGHSSQHLQGMQESGCEEKQPTPPIVRHISSELAGGIGEIEGRAERASVRLGCAVGRGADIERAVPIERAAIRYEGCQEYVDTVARPDRPRSRIHEAEYTSNSVRTECSAGDVGRGETIFCGGCGDQASIERIDDIISEISIDIEAENGGSWVDSLFLDLGRDGYSCGACVTPAAGIGAPHIRQRLWWVADTDDARLEGWRGDGRERAGQLAAGEGGVARILANTAESGWREQPLGLSGPDGRNAGAGVEAQGGAGLRAVGHDAGPSGAVGGVVYASGDEQQADRPGCVCGEKAENEAGIDCGDRTASAGAVGGPCPTNGLWRDPDWLFCRDGKWRPAQSFFQSMADGIPKVLGRLRPDAIASLETEVASYAAKFDRDASQDVLDLWQELPSPSAPEWLVGAYNSISKKEVLFAFMCQLSSQGWHFAHRLPQAREPISGETLRSLWQYEAAASASRQRRLDGQRSRQSADALHFLSSVLAQNAHSCWGEALQKNAADRSPLASGIPGRVGRLRAYGNAIVPQAAAEVIAAFMECMP